MFSSSQRCRPPHVNQNVLRNNLFERDFLRHTGNGSAEELFNYLLELNSVIARIPRNIWRLTKRAPHVHGKALANEFFLGMTDVWFYHPSLDGLEDFIVTTEIKLGEK